VCSRYAANCPATLVEKRACTEIPAKEGVKVEI